jgi:hypothetical protein
MSAEMNEIQILRGEHDGEFQAEWARVFKEVQALNLPAGKRADIAIYKLWQSARAAIHPSTVVAAAERIAHLEGEEEISNAVIGKMSRILARIAITLKGEEAPLCRHGYQDLAELVAVLQLEVDLYRAIAEEK